MAHPDHVADLDGLDRLTVRLYRTGLCVSAVVIMARGLVEVGSGPAWLTSPGLVVFGVALSAANLHLYDKRVRWLMGALAWMGAVLTVAAYALDNRVVTTAGTGFLFVLLSGLALKEQFCFRIPGLGLVPLLLAGAVFSELALLPRLAGAFLIPAGFLLGWLAIAKLRQPLHFDVGDKSYYQV